MLSLITPREALPISVLDAKRHCVIDIDFTDDDTYLEALIEAAADDFEHRTGRTLLTSTWELNTNDATDGVEARIRIFTNPVQSITSVTAMLTDGTTTVLDSADYSTHLGQYPALVKIINKPANVEGWTVRFVAGKTDAASIPKLQIHGIKFLVAHFYQHREPIHEMGTMARSLPLAYESIVRLAELKVSV